MVHYEYGMNETPTKGGSMTLIEGTRYVRETTGCTLVKAKIAWQSTQNKRLAVALVENGSIDAFANAIDATMRLEGIRCI